MLLLTISDIITAALLLLSGSLLHPSSPSTSSPSTTSPPCHSPPAATSLPRPLGLGAWSALLLLWSPLSAAAAIAGAASSLLSLPIALALASAAAGNPPLAAMGNPPLAAMGMALCMLLSPSSTVLLVPVLLLLLNRPSSQSAATIPVPASAKHTAPAVTPSPATETAEAAPAAGAAAGATTATATTHSPPRPSPLRLHLLLPFLLLLALWLLTILAACHLLLLPYGGLLPAFSHVYPFALQLSDLTPNLGLRWYFFAEAFAYIRPFYSFVFSAMLLLVLPPLTLRLHRRPFFLAFALLLSAHIVAPYPTVGESGFILALLPLFLPQLSGSKHVPCLLPFGAVPSPSVAFASAIPIPCATMHSCSHPYTALPPPSRSPLSIAAMRFVFVILLGYILVHTTGPFEGPPKPSPFSLSLLPLPPPSRPPGLIAAMRFVFVILLGYLLVHTMGPTMWDLWILKVRERG
ncbi:unnamed protein product [Closterium sp. NIES-64]|nr:unnamed protein product [Closterium sp. NIES-64]